MQISCLPEIAHYCEGRSTRKTLLKRSPDAFLRLKMHDKLSTILEKGRLFWSAYCSRFQEAKFYIILPHFLQNITGGLLTFW